MIATINRLALLASRLLLIIGLCVAIPRTALATTIFDDGGVNVLTGPIDDIEVRDSVSAAPTFVISNGAQIGFQLNPDDTLFIDPGTMEPVSANDDHSIAIFDTSIVSMSGGETADSVVANDISRFAMTSGDVGDDVIANDNASVTIAGGSFDDLFVNDNATAAMSGGSIDNPEVDGSGQFLFSGGRVDDMNITGNGRVVVSGTALIDDDAFFTGSARLETTGGQFDDELQFYDTTTASLNGGNVGDDLVAAGSSQIDILDFTISDTLEAEGSSNTNVFGGTIGVIESLESSVVNFFGGTVEEGVIAILGGTVNVDGGVFAPIDAPEVLANLNGTVNIESTVSDELDIESTSGGQVNVIDATVGSMGVNALAGDVDLLGGEADSLEVFAELEGTVEVFGGDFLVADFEAQSGATITIYGTEFFAFGQPLGFGPIPFIAGDLTGTLSDGSPLNATFRRQFFPVDEAAQIILVQLPEPGSVLIALVAVATSTASRRRV
ncbi:hypothetical protein MalM25_07820 [Planctomycetes bacterium MalM25]|nr:hypothetical protein MalM25_07820 [Planctomycetes bacterium MalM25]